MKLSLSGFLILAMTVLGLPSQGLTTTYTANLDGTESGSPGTGFVTVDLDTSAHTLSIDLNFGDLLGTTTVAHIHGPTATPGTGNAGVITEVPFFSGFPIGVTSGTYTHVFDSSNSSTWNPSFLSDNSFTTEEAEAALDSYLLAGTAYLNIHTTFNPAGEIRGFLAVSNPVPEPATLLLFVTGLAGLVGGRRLRK